MRIFFHCLQAEWLKKKRSLGSWLVVVGSLFTPAIVLVVRLLHPASLPALYANSAFWTSLWKSSWESMSIFFLPMAAILSTSLITQIEYRNNAWKQVRTLPLPPLTLFLAKLAVIAILMIEFFALFDLGVYLSAILPSLLIPGVPYPAQPLPVWAFLADTGVYMVACLPIVALQYLLSLQFKNFLVPVGVGFMTWVAALAALSTKFSWLIPYAYTMLHYLKDDAKGRVQLPTSQLQGMSLGYTLLFLAVGYILFANQKQQG